MSQLSIEKKIKLNRLDFQHDIYFGVFYISVTIIASLHCISTRLSAHFKFSSFYMLFDDLFYLDYQSYLILR